METQIPSEFAHATDLLSEAEVFMSYPHIVRSQDLEWSMAGEDT